MHIPGEAETVVVSDQSSVIALSDNLLRVEAPGPFLAHVELQASDEPVGAPEYNVLARRRHRLPVMSTVYEGLGYTLIVIPSLPGAERGSFVLSFL